FSRPMSRRPPRAPPLPYTTLFRSGEVLKEPRGRTAHGPATEPAEVPGVEPFEDLIEPEKDVGPGQPALGGRVRPERRLGRLEKQFGDPQLRRQLADGFERVENAERNDDGPRPARHGVDVEVG